MIARSMHRIEVTTRCQWACEYCLNPVLTRPKMDMRRDTWLAALEWVRYYRRRGGQQELLLFGCGEPFLHPNFVEMVAEAREAMGPEPRILISTNAVAITPEQIAALVPLRLRIYVSLHRPVEQSEAIRALAASGMLLGVTTDPVTGSLSWCGQVDWPDIGVKGAARLPCPHLQYGLLYAGSDGTLYACGYVNGDAPTLGHVSEAPHDLEVTPPGDLCAKCFCRIPTEADAPVRISR